MTETPKEVFRFLAALKKAGARPNLRRIYAEVIKTVIGDNPARAAYILDVIPKEVKDAFEELGFTAPSNPDALIFSEEDYSRLEHLLQVCIFVSSANEEVFRILCKLIDTEEYKNVWSFLIEAGAKDPKVLEKLYEVYSPFGKGSSLNWSKQLTQIRDHAPRSTTDGS